MAQVNTYKNLSASGSILLGTGTLSGMYVNSITAGAIMFYDSLTGTSSATKITNVITPTVGYHNLGNVNCLIGCYASMHGAMDYTTYTRFTD